jgi:hypothetical protein
MIEVLAALSASAAGGMRIALPLLLIGILQAESLWSRFPVLSGFPPPLVVGVLVSWSLFELFASKKLLGQRVLLVVQLVCSPLVGAILAMGIAQITLVEQKGMPSVLVWIIGVVGGLLALVLQLVQAGWFYRLRGLPVWVIFLQDALCVCLVLFAFDAPRQGGLIALLLLWLAIRSSKDWYKWYLEQGPKGKPRKNKSHPD